MQTPTALPALPRHTKKIIHWHENGGLATVQMGYGPDRLSYFLAMFALAKESFPDLTKDDCTCGKVSHSIYNKGFTILSFSVPLTAKSIKGWEHRGPCDFGF